jgi:hypothetical protein
MHKIEEASEFEDWLSPEVVNTLISTYAVKDRSYGALKWKYAPLPPKRWGAFDAGGPVLYVNKSKTKGMFKQQVQTILHEIQHWNQFVDVTDIHRTPIVDDRDEERVRKISHGDRKNRLAVWRNKYDRETRMMGYFNNSFEMGARDFSEENLEAAMRMLGEMHYGAVGKIEGSNIDDAVDEIVQDYIDKNEGAPQGKEKPVTRLDIGRTLQVHNLNNATNMKVALKMLHDLEIKVV